MGAVIPVPAADGPATKDGTADAGSADGRARADATGNPDQIASTLQRYVDDYRDDPSMTELDFGIKVGDSWWHVASRPVSGDDKATVTLKAGKPEQPTFYYTLDRDTLGKLDRGELNAKTAMVKAFSTDVTPMDIEVMEGFQPDGDFIGVVLPATFHFWTRGLPEIIPFGDSYTRESHGADVAVFYYQPGMRSAWGSLKKGQHANADQRSQVNPFPSLLIVTSGKGSGRIGGKEITLSDGNALLIPPGVTHEFWNSNDQAMEFILLMFGEGA